MKTAICLMFACAVTAAPALAQAPPAAQGGQKIPLSEGLRRSYNTLKMNLTEAAQKFDDANYGYTPSPDIRGFGAQLAHVANSQFNACAAAKGEANPHQGTNLEKTKTTRADIRQALTESMDYCDRAFASMHDATKANTPRPFRQAQFPALAILNFRNYHALLHWGNAITYMRLRGKVPPSA